MERRIHEVCVLTQEQVALIEGVSQRTIARAERSALRKLRDNPQAKLLLRYICQQASKDFSPAIEPAILRKLGTTSADMRFHAPTWFAPNL